VGHKRGISFIDLSNEKFQLLTPHFQGNVNQISAPVDTDIYIATSDGLYIYDILFNKMRISENEILSGQRVHSTFRDQNNTHWVSVGSGLVNSDPLKNIIKTYRTEEKYSRFESVNRFWSICNAYKDVFIVGGDGGLSQFDETRLLKPFILKHKGESLKNISFILRENEAIVWFCTFDKGVYRFDMMQMRVEQFTDDDPKNSILSNTVKHALLGSDGNIYFATDKGVAVFDNKSMQFKPAHINSTLNSIELLTTSLFEDTNGVLWIGSQNGLFRCDLETLEYQKYSSNSVPGLTNNHVRTIHGTQDGSIYIGTSVGLNKLNITLNSFEHFTIADGLPNDVIYSIEEDEDGDLWMGTNKGIALLHDNKFVHYNKFDGLQGNQFNTNASYADPNGQLFFGGLYGMNSFYPLELKNAIREYDVKILEFEILPHDDHSGRVYTYPNIPDLRLDYEQCSFVIKASDINFSNPENTTFQYQLIGYDHDWKTSKSNLMSYMNLPSGKYEFKVRRINKFGVPSSEVAYLDIKINAPFWNSVWFKSSLGAFFILGLYAYFLSRNRAQKRINRKLSETVTLKTKDLIDKTRELEISNQQNKNLLNTISDEFVIVDKDYSVQYCNSFMSEMVSSKFSIILSQGKNIIDHFLQKVHPQYVNTFQNLVNRVFECGEVIMDEITIIGEDRPLYRMLSYSPRFDDHGIVYQCMVSMRDVKSLKEAELLKNRSETLLRLFFDNSPVGIAFVSANAEDLAPDCNQQLCHMLGYNKKDLLSQSLLKICHEDEREEAISSFMDTLKNNRNRLDFKEKRLIKKNGSSLLVNISATLLYKEDRSLDHLFILITDISAEKEIELKLERARNKLIASDKMISLGYLTAGIAHEINNPVNFIYNGVNNLEKIINDTSLFSSKTVPEEVTHDMADMLLAIKDGANRTASIVKSLREFTREDTTNYVKCNIIDGLESTLRLLSSKIENDIFIEKKYGASVMEIFCFPGQLNQVFMNVILNGLEAIEGAGTLEIRIKFENENVLIIIRDTGKGIPSHVKERVFDPFFTTKSLGSGLGLSITYSIIQRHGGTIDIHSIPERGTSILITLPRENKSLITQIGDKEV